MHFYKNALPVINAHFTSPGLKPSFQIERTSCSLKIIKKKISICKYMIIDFQVNPNRLKIYELAESRVNKNRTQLACSLLNKRQPTVSRSLTRSPGEFTIRLTATHYSADTDAIPAPCPSHDTQALIL
jgi:hypothetical protein